MDATPKKNLTIIASVGVVILGIGYLLFFKSGGLPQDLVQAPATPISEAQRSFLVLLQELKQVSFDTSFFQDPYFASLRTVDFSVTPETKGKKDPFAPL